MKESKTRNQAPSPALLERLNRRFEAAAPDSVLSWGYRHFGSEVVLGTGFGPSGMVLIHRLQQLGMEIPVFYLDTGQLFRDTYELRDRIEKRFGIAITPIVPALSLEEQEVQFGKELWKRNPDLCCYHRKVLPLRTYLSGKKAWITGVRWDQSESRGRVRFVEWDSENNIVKLNPLANWPGEQVWSYIRSNGLPYNPLHDRGYPSIGCIPCTQPVHAGEDKRAGRWRGTAKTECGIHISRRPKNSEAG